MLKRFLVVCMLALALVCAGSATAQDGAITKALALKVGDAAPDFELKGSDGKTYTLSQFKGKKHVVLAFFPKAFTGG
jgi:peroxiredoxin Q/BCP